MAKKEKKKATDTLDMLKYFFINARAAQSAATERLLKEHHRPYYQRLFKYMAGAQLFELDARRLIGRTEDLKTQVTGVHRGEQVDRVIADAYINGFNLFNHPLPAPRMYIGFNKNIEYEGIEDILSEDYTTSRQTGIFISKDIIAIFNEYVNKTGALRHDASVLYCDGAWTAVSYVDDPTVVRLHHVAMINAIVDTINECTAIAVDHTTEKSYVFKTNLWNKKRVVKTPTAFYRVGLQKSTPHSGSTKSVIDDTTPRQEKSFAYYVLGHYKYRVKTGRNPIDPIIENRLLLNKDRKIFYDSTQLDEKSLAVLAKRNISVGVNDWVAILEYRVEGHVANTKGGKNTYIPSIHTNV